MLDAFMRVCLSKPPNSATVYMAILNSIHVACLGLICPRIRNVESAYALRILPNDEHEANQDQSMTIK